MTLVLTLNVLRQLVGWVDQQLGVMDTGLQLTY